MKKLKADSLNGKMLVASPIMDDPNFVKSVIYVVSHNNDGTIGIVVNNALKDIDSKKIFDYLNIKPKSDNIYMPVHIGGCVDQSSGFILHTKTDGEAKPGTVESGDLALSMTSDILKEIAEGKGPSSSLFAFGYTSWSTGQLENEIENNFWYVIPPDNKLIFSNNNNSKWDSAIKMTGAKAPYLLSPKAGHA